LTLVECGVSGNRATGGNGGGIANGSGARAADGVLTIEKSTIGDNSAGQGGGGIASQGTLTLSLVNVERNSAA
jgi:predicted outer membrane repeat protein